MRFAGVNGVVITWGNGAALRGVATVALVGAHDVRRGRVDEVGVARAVERAAAGTVDVRTGLGGWRERTCARARDEGSV